MFVHSINYDHKNQIYDYFSKGFDRIKIQPYLFHRIKQTVRPMYNVQYSLMEHHSIYRVAIYAYKNIVLEIFYE